MYINTMGNNWKLKTIESVKWTYSIIFSNQRLSVIIFGRYYSRYVLRYRLNIYQFSQKIKSSFSLYVWTSCYRCRLVLYYLTDVPIEDFLIFNFFMVVVLILITVDHKNVSNFDIISICVHLLFLRKHLQCTQTPSIISALFRFDQRLRSLQENDWC